MTEVDVVQVEDEVHVEVKVESGVRDEPEVQVESEAVQVESEEVQVEVGVDDVQVPVLPVTHVPLDHVPVVHVWVPVIHVPMVQVVADDVEVVDVDQGTTKGGGRGLGRAKICSLGLTRKLPGIHPPSELVSAMGTASPKAVITATIKRETIPEHFILTVSEVVTFRSK